MQIMSQDEYIGNNRAYLEQTDGMRPAENIRGVQGQTTKQEAAWRRILNQAINLESGTGAPSGLTLPLSSSVVLSWSQEVFSVCLPSP